MPNSASLHGLSVLVLEDDFYIAEDTKDALLRAGAVVLGPFATAKEAMVEAERAGVDCALVDLNLGNGPEFDTLDSLRRQRVPVVLVTGYDMAAIPEALANVPRLQKPAHPRRLVAAVAAACGRSL